MLDIKATLLKINFIYKFREALDKVLLKQQSLILTEIESNLLLPPLEWKNLKKGNWDSVNQRCLLTDFIYVYIEKGMGIDWLIEFSRGHFLSLTTHDGIILYSQTNGTVEASICKHHSDFEKLKKKHSITIGSD